MMHCWAKQHHLRNWRPLSALGLDPVSSHSPSAPLILSKSHYNPTNPTAYHHDCLLSGSPALHIRTWNWAGGFFFLPHYHLWENWFFPVSVPFFLVTAAKCIRGPAAGPEGASFGEVGGNSVTGLVLEETAFFYWPLGASFCFCPCSYAVTEKYPKVKKNYWWFSVKIPQMKVVGRKES